MPKRPTKKTAEKDNRWELVKEHLQEFINRTDELPPTQMLNLFSLSEMDKSRLGELLLAAKERPMKEFVADAILLQFLMTWCNLTGGK